MSIESMEIEMTEESEFVGGHSSASTSVGLRVKTESPPPQGVQSPKERLLHILDEVDKHVDVLRRDAMRLEEEKDVLLTTLDTLRNSEMADLTTEEREEVVTYAEGMTTRCLTVEVIVKTVRDPNQEDALHQVNDIIDSLIRSVRNDPISTKSRCETYMNACTSQGHGVVDRAFELAILGCTMDDQKRVKKRLQGLLDYIDHF